MKEYIPAIDELIKYYSHFKWWQKPKCREIDCPLCKIAGRDKNGIAECDKGRCPWVVYEGHVCYAILFTCDRTYKRLKRLERWKKLIEERTP